jgi:hypothetical protein
MEIFKATGEKRYYKIAEVFWKAVTSARTYAPGGLGEGEMFHERGRIGDLLTKNSEESCASYNMLKLTKELYQYQPKAAYMDYYERTVTNHTLAAGDKKATGETTYFFPLGPGMKREFYYENSCCHGTGMESPFKYREAIYFEEKNCIYINLFISSELRSEEKGVIIRQKSAEKYPGQIQLYIKGSGYNTIKIRKPEWAEKYQILEAERQLEIEADTDGYLMLTGDFTEGKTYEIHFSYRFRYIPTPDKPELTAIQYGPYIMAALSEEQDFITFPYTEAEVGEKMIPQKHSLEFVCDGVTWIPLCMVDDQAYHAYVKCPETVKA